MNRVNVRVADFTANTKSVNNGPFHIKNIFSSRSFSDIFWRISNSVLLKLIALHIITTLIMVIEENIVQLQFKYVIDKNYKILWQFTFIDPWKSNVIESSHTWYTNDPKNSITSSERVKTTRISKSHRTVHGLRAIVDNYNKHELNKYFRTRCRSPLRNRNKNVGVYHFSSD